MREVQRLRGVGQVWGSAVVTGPSLCTGVGQCCCDKSESLCRCGGVLLRQVRVSVQVEHMAGPCQPPNGFLIQGLGRSLD